MFIKKLSFLESFANFTFSETNYHVHLHPSAPRHLLLPPAHPCQHPAPPPVGVVQFRPLSCDEPAPATEQDVVMDREPIVDEAVVDQLNARTRKCRLDKGSHMSGNPVQSLWNINNQSMYKYMLNG